MRVGFANLRRQMSGPWWLAGGVSPSDVVAAYQAKGAATLAASYVNLANPGTYDAAPGVAPTIGEDGWVCAGSQTLATGITPANNQTWSMFARFSGCSGLARAVCGAWTSGPAFYLVPRRGSAGNNRSYATGNVLHAGVRLESGVMGIAGTKAYLDGAEDGTIGASAGAIGPIALLALGNLSGWNMVGSVQAIVIYSATITTAQVAALTAAMEAL